MTTLQSVVRRRAVAVAGAVSAGLLVLSACDKPTPVATLTVGQDSVNSEALCYNDGDALDAESLKKCLKKADDAKSIKVGQDETVRIGVDPEIAKQGWVVLVNGRPFSDVSKETYRTIPSSAFFNVQYGTQGETNTLAIQSGEKAKKGLWTFKLKKA
ncbi:DUF2771 domain-containing protein [Streptomyces actinomycinicus]|uniref:DUF2771 domain-containing protein n=1 Tax=Streptomyces actinomycinicus TaxID=1695166 RepID=A0A937JKZ1_9ACTN|nr:DUF2771 domain-containing protein [Streptomyces actinomycinicus]MBL1081880.1 DUF2771 domain-containing protein [Streptomyces actinomycinicus]